MLIVCSRRSQDALGFSSILLIISRSTILDKEVWLQEFSLDFSKVLTDDDERFQQSSHVHLFPSGHCADTSISFCVGNINFNKNSTTIEKSTEKIEKNGFYTILHHFNLIRKEGSVWKINNYHRLTDLNFKSNWIKYLQLFRKQSNDYVVVVSDDRMQWSEVIVNETNQTIRNGSA